MTNYEEMREKAGQAFKEGKVILVFSRVCTAPDKEGVTKILRDNPSVSLMHLSKVLPWDSETTESFYSINDEVLAKECRKALEEEWLT